MPDGLYSYASCACVAGFASTLCIYCQKGSPDWGYEVNAWDMTPTFGVPCLQVSHKSDQWHQWLGSEPVRSVYPSSTAQLGWKQEHRQPFWGGCTLGFDCQNLRTVVKKCWTLWNSWSILVMGILERPGIIHTWARRTDSDWGQLEFAHHGTCVFKDFRLHRFLLAHFFASVAGFPGKTSVEVCSVYCNYSYWCLVTSCFFFQILSHIISIHIISIVSIIYLCICEHVRALWINASTVSTPRQSISGQMEGLCWRCWKGRMQQTATCASLEELQLGQWDVCGAGKKVGAPGTSCQASGWNMAGKWLDEFVVLAMSVSSDGFVSS